MYARIELVGTSVYGIRKYTRGAYLLSHLDHLKTHVVSAILNVAQVRWRKCTKLSKDITYVYACVNYLFFDDNSVGGPDLFLQKLGLKKNHQAHGV